MKQTREQPQRLAFERALTFLRNGDAEMAEQMCENALAEFGQDANFLCLSGRALIMLGRYAQAEERLNNAITLSPDFPRPHVIRGELRLMQGRIEQAVEELRLAIELGDDDPATQLKLGRALMLEGDRQAAGDAIDAFMRKNPDRERLVQAFELEQTGKPAEAEKIYRDILARDPENVDALRLLAGTATALNQHRDAEILLKRALELAPDYGKAMADLVNNQIEQEKLEEAHSYATRLIRIGGDNPDSHLLFGNVLSAAGDYQGAIDAYKKSLEIAPEHPGALSGLGHSLKTLGQQDEAIAAYRQCLKFNPLFTETYWSLANLKTFRFSEQEVRSMEELLGRPDAPKTAQEFLCNALATEYEKRAQYDRAMEHFARCNALRRQKEYYDPVETEVLHDAIIEVFDQEFLSQPAADDFDTIPIFIVGLPRSGSTLIEQVLASHTLVEGTHELSDLPRVIKQMPKLLGMKESYPAAIQSVDAAGFAKLGRTYLERTGKFRAGERYFTDKNPNNFAHVGLIHLALPQAVVIDARRHPLDSCLGTFKQLFAKGQPFSYDLSEVAGFYLEYERLMAHWDEVLPGKVLHVRYEDVVRDLESEVKRILEHCGLPFEAQCLRFHETERAVKTASSEQVRQPIYSTSVNLWRHYEKHLAPAIEILDPVLRRLPASEQPASMQAD